MYACSHWSAHVQCGHVMCLSVFFSNRKEKIAQGRIFRLPSSMKLTQRKERVLFSWQMNKSEAHVQGLWGMLNLALQNPEEIIKYKSMCLEQHNVCASKSDCLPEFPQILRDLQQTQNQCLFGKVYTGCNLYSSWNWNCVTWKWWCYWKRLQRISVDQAVDYIIICEGCSITWEHGKYVHLQGSWHIKKNIPFHLVQMFK